MKMSVKRLQKDHPDWTWKRSQMREGHSRYRGDRKYGTATERAVVFPLGDDWMVDYASTTKAGVTITGRPEEYGEWTEYIHSKCPPAYDTPFDAMKDPGRGIKRGVEARKCSKCGDWHLYEHNETLGE